MKDQKATTNWEQREWHFPLVDKEVEFRGRRYRLGICCVENVRGLTAVAEITSADLDGGNPGQIVFSTVAEAIRYFDALARASGKTKERRE